MKKIIILTLTILTFSSCKLIEDIISIPGNTGEQIKNTTEALLDDAIAKIGQQSESWEATLENLSNQLTDEAQSTIRNEVQNLLKNTIQAAGEEISCRSEFYGKRMQEELGRLKAKLLNKPLPEKQPIVCTTHPEIIKLDEEPNNRSQIKFSGYNFDNHSSLKLFLLTGSQLVDVTAHLHRTSNYSMIANLSGSGIILNDNMKEIRLYYSNGNYYSVPIAPRIIPDCQVKLYTHPARDVIDFVPPHKSGDKDFWGNGPEIYTAVTIFIEDNIVKAEILMTAQETKNGDTRAEGRGIFTIYTPEPNWIIQKITTDTFTEHRYIHSTWDPYPVNTGSGELVNRFEFVGDVWGEESGTKTKVRVIFNPIKVELKEIGNCRN